MAWSGKSTILIILRLKFPFPPCPYLVKVTSTVANPTFEGVTISDGNINGFRAYFRLKGESVSLARAFRMSFEDDVTGITTVISDEPTTASGTYTLDGRRMEEQPTQKGVYIVNGKKTIIK